MSFAERHWYRLSPLSVVLFPASLVFRGVVALRRWLYRVGLLKSVRVRVPVIVVGNLTVGGTGKTPLVLWLAQQLRTWGASPGIVCRGYGGRLPAPQQVVAGADPADVGDEALLLAERSGCPVWTGADRAAAAIGLLEAYPGCSVIVSDDGLQHYGLQRDLELAVEDERGAGNGLMLPAGPLREPPNRNVDVRVVNSEIAGDAGKAAVTAARTVRMRLAPAGFYRVGAGNAPVQPADLAGKRLHAVAGIGNPGRFFAALARLGLAITPHPFPDHHRYSSDELRFPDCDYILMTEKDAVKCRCYGRADLIAVRVEAEPDPVLAETIKNRILHGCAPA